MAQGNKSRIIIWTIVGILVVVAVVMLVTKPKDTGRPIKPEELSRSFERQFGRLDNRIAKAQSEYPGAPAEQWQKINEQMALGRDVLSRVPGLTEQKDLVAKRESLKDAYVTVNRELKAITGKDVKDTSEGGE